MPPDYRQGCPWCLENIPDEDLFDPEKPTFRIYYEVFVTSNKQVYVRFEGSCDDCGRAYKFVKLVKLTDEVRAHT